MGANVQVVWEKFANYWDVEPRYVPLEGNVWSEGEQASVGECLLVQPRARLSLSQSALVLLAAEGSI